VDMFRFRHREQEIYLHSRVGDDPEKVLEAAHLLSLEVRC